MVWVAHATPIKSIGFSRGPFEQHDPRRQRVGPSLASGPLATQRRLLVISGVLAARLHHGCHGLFDGHLPRIPGSAQVAKARSDASEIRGQHANIVHVVGGSL